MSATRRERPARPENRHAPRGRTPGTAAAALAGGVLWAPFGVLEFLSPLGPDTVFDPDRGFEVVVDRAVHAISTAPGALALLLCALALWALLGEATDARGARRARLPAGAAAVLGVVALAGVAAGFDPLFTAPRVLGTLLLGAGAWLAADALRARPWSGHLRALGLTGVAVMPLWPAVYALKVVPRAGGAAFLVAFGAGWVALAARLARDGRPA